MIIKFNIDEDFNNIENNIPQNIDSIKPDYIKPEINYSSIESNTTTLKDMTLKDIKFLAREKLSGRLLLSSILSFTAIILPLIVIIFGSILSSISVINENNPNIVLIIVGLLLYLVGIILSIGLYAGHTAYYINLHKGTAKFSDLITNFNLTWGYFKIIFLMSLFIMLWSIIPIIGIYFGIKAMLQYALAPYIFIDDSSKGALECINESKVKTYGYKGKFILLGLSFFGWLILCSISTYTLMTLSLMVAMSGQIKEMATLNVNLNSIDPSVLLNSTMNSLPLIIIGFSIIFLIPMILAAPITSYISASIVEFYYMVMGNPSTIVKETSTQSKKEKFSLIIVTGLLALLFAITSTILMSQVADKIVEILKTSPIVTSKIGIQNNTEYLCDQDNSYLVIDNNKFIWYKSKNELTNNYIKGDLTQYQGEDAKNLLVNDKTELGVTEEEIDRLYGDNLSLLDIWVVSNLEIKSDEHNTSQREYFAYINMPNTNNKLHLINLYNASEYTFSPYKNTDENKIESNTNTNIIETQPSTTENKNTTTDNSIFDFKYSVPSNYIHQKDMDYSDNYSKSSSYLDSNTYYMIHIDEDIDYADLFEITTKYYDDIQPYTTKNKINGKIYKAKTFDEYYFSTINKNNVITISSTDKNDLIKVLDTLKL